MAWFDDKATGEELSSDEWDNHVIDQENRGYNDLQTVTSDTTASPQEIILADASGGALTITLPAPESAANVTVKKISGSGNTVTVATPNSETIDGSSSISLGTQYNVEEITSDGTNYFLL
jgi:hypothetical protein